MNKPSNGNHTRYIKTIPVKCDARAAIHALDS